MIEEYLRQAATSLLQGPMRGETREIVLQYASGEGKCMDGNRKKHHQVGSLAEVLKRADMGLTKLQESEEPSLNAQEVIKRKMEYLG